MECCGGKIPMTYVIMRIILVMIPRYELLLCLTEELCQAHSAEVYGSQSLVWQSFLTCKHLIYQCQSNTCFRGYEGASCHCLPAAGKNTYVLTNLPLGQPVMTASTTAKPHFSTGIAEWLKCGPEVIWEILQFKKSHSSIRLLRVLAR